MYTSPGDVFSQVALSGPYVVIGDQRFKEFLVFSSNSLRLSGTRTRVMNHLYYGDTLQILRERIKDESANLAYPDLAFNSQSNDHVL